MGVSVTLLAVAEDSNDIESRRAALLARQQQAALPHAELRVRVGEPAEQIILQQNEVLYSVVMLGLRGRKPLAAPVTAARRPRYAGRLDGLTMTVLELSPTPVMVVRNSRPHIKRMLVCTAAGEPGKTDVRVGGRLARRLGTRVDLLHVAREGEEPGQLAQAHLERGSATLRGLDVPVDVIVHKAASPAEGILTVSRAGDYDLIVIGNHGPQSRSIFGRDDIMLQVLALADRPVLVVPSEELW